MFKGFYLPLIRAKIFGQRAPAPPHAGGGPLQKTPWPEGHSKPSDLYKYKILPNSLLIFESFQHQACYSSPGKI